MDKGFLHFFIVIFPPLQCFWHMLACYFSFLLDFYKIGFFQYRLTSLYCTLLHITNNHSSTDCRFVATLCWESIDSIFQKHLLTSSLCVAFWLSSQYCKLFITIIYVWWSVFSDPWYYYCNCLGASPTTPI